MLIIAVRYQKNVICPVPKREVACELFDRTIELHHRGDSYLAALQLGGGEGEVLPSALARCQLLKEVFPSLFSI